MGDNLDVRCEKVFKNVWWYEKSTAGRYSSVNNGGNKRRGKRVFQSGRQFFVAVETKRSDWGKVVLNEKM